MKKLLVLLMACLVATTAFAVIDPDPDMMGIYFDLNADDNCLTIGPMTVYFAYLILTNPTAPAINAYEFGLDIVVPAGSENMFFRLASNINNPGGCYHDDAGRLGGDYYVGLAFPIPAEPATLLHIWQYMLLDAIPVEMYIHSTSAPSIPGDFPVVQNAEGSILMQVGLSTGGPDIPVATVNTDCVVDVEETSFGSLKALYR